MDAYQSAYDYATTRGAPAGIAGAFARHYERLTGLVTQGRALTGFSSATSGPARLWPAFLASR